MKTRVSIILIGLLVPLLVFSQTPKQFYFQWSSMPFSLEELAQRRNNFIKNLVAEGKNGIVIIPSKDGLSDGETFRQLDDFYYFTGLELPNSLLVIDLKSESSIIYAPETDVRFESDSRPNDFPGKPLVADEMINERSGLKLKKIVQLPSFLDKLAAKSGTVLLNYGRNKEVFLDPQEYIATYLPQEVLLQALQSKHKGLVYDNCYEAIAKVRMIKSAAEIELMRKATAINVEGIIAAAKTIKPGVDERYLEGILEGSYKVSGSQRLAFGSIIKSGPNSLWPWRILATHYDRRNRTMEVGDLVIFDVGCEYNNYVSDVGRTFPVSGKFTDRQREILTMEVSIADQIIAVLKPGITFADIKQLTDSILPADAKPYMQASLHFGHHLGLSTGDPNLPETKLEEGMIFTVEPWYYNHDEGISVFTEDVILITRDGHENLSRSLPRTPEGLENLMKE